MEPVSVGIREFRSRLAEYLLESDRPVVVTRHGATVGYFVPAGGARMDLDRAALTEAAVRMNELLRAVLGQRVRGLIGRYSERMPVQSW